MSRYYKQHVLNQVEAYEITEGKNKGRIHLSLSAPVLTFSREDYEWLLKEKLMKI